MIGIEPEVVLLVAAALFLGALVQGVVGLGLGLVAAPVVTLVEPALMPGLLLVLGMLLPLVTLTRERTDIDWRGLGWSMPMRVPGTAIGAWLVATADARVLGVVVGVVVLGAVGLSVRAVDVPLTRGSLSVAGLVSGVTGTVTMIGGPPIALLYQHRPPTQVRPTLAVYFVVGAALSLVGLLVAGELTGQQVLLGLALVPTLVLGIAAAVPLRERVDRRRFRQLVLLVCTAAAVTLLVRAALM